MVTDPSSFLISVRSQLMLLYLHFFKIDVILILSMMYIFCRSVTDAVGSVKPWCSICFVLINNEQSGGYHVHILYI